MCGSYPVQPSTIDLQTRTKPGMIFAYDLGLDLLVYNLVSDAGQLLVGMIDLNGLLFTPFRYHVSLSTRFSE